MQVQIRVCKLNILADRMPRLLTMVLHKVQDHENRMNNLLSIMSTTLRTKAGMDADEKEEN